MLYLWEKKTILLLIISKLFAFNIGLSDIQFKKNYSAILKLAINKLDEALSRSFLPEEMQESFKNEFLERYNRIVPANY